MEDIKTARDEISKNQQQLKEQIKTQEEIFVSMLNKFKELFVRDKTKILEDIDELKSQQDILKISYTINEKQLLEKIEAMIENEIRVAVKGKEQEILMKLWIKELKEIIANFERLKKVQPKEFTLQINEISNTIELFKQKLER